MKVPVSWLKEYVQVNLPLEDLAHRLTMAGLEVESITAVGESWQNVLVGQVVRVEKHPNADRLRLVTVDFSQGVLTVVCGAPNVAERQKVAFAQVGARLIDPNTGQPRKLEAARIRGVASEGMVSSERELGLGEDHDGILVLPEDAPVGAPLRDYLGDFVLDFAISPNRPDCLSVLGIAREVAALTGAEVREPELTYPEVGNPIADQAAVEIWDPELCPRYCASLVTGVRVGPSPRWMQDRLAAAGMRPINNVVDITNYVMLEYDQPLHAFDFLTLRGRKIIVRRARPGESIVTLDGMERKLEDQMLVIADAAHPVAIAGVMGGGDTEVTESTTAVLLESANFLDTSIRRTAPLLKLRTEASLRFDKGLSQELPQIALRRATQFFVQLTGATAEAGVLDVFPGKAERQPLTLSLERVRKVLGVSPTAEELAQVLGCLGFRCETGDDQRLLVTVPYWRRDITVEDDLAEEYARITGYERIPTPAPSGRIPLHEPQPLRELKERVRDILVSLGLQEIITYSLVSRRLLENLNSAASLPEPLRAANPMSPEQECLRTTLRPSLLATLASNQSRQLGEETVELFESGRVYLPGGQDLPEEREMVAVAITGSAVGLGWLEQPREANFFDLKGFLESLLAQLHLDARIEPASDSDFLPGRCAAVMAGADTLGVLGEVHPQVLERFDLSLQPVFLLELDLQHVLSHLSPAGPSFKALSRFPGVSRDLALVVDDGVPAGRVEGLLRSSDLVSRVVLFDVYKGDKVPPGKKSLAFRIVCQSSQRTLTSEEVNLAQERLLSLLEREVGAKLRG